MQVDTSSAGFRSTPMYFTSLAGTSTHWNTTGATSVYPPDSTLGGDLRRGFRIYLRFADGAALDPLFAKNNGWHIQYMAVE
ncbi:hypothetical protein [Nonomuraea endophytica]|uniref:Uncharacterized protein n=1 Tax=Nonomuraea endophytica TaxID=714136 RepID=A0A7W8ELK2_9ACTN|nr:hypothetical protein [Nonomuraea endophytica]MBB5083979.1 hypothetical protein [Nonomuraea endophytica]